MLYGHGTTTGVMPKEAGLPMQRVRHCVYDSAYVVALFIRFGGSGHLKLHCCVRFARSIPPQGAVALLKRSEFFCNGDCACECWPNTDRTSRIL